jgi:nucleoside-diphosphate-sugar epimerase
MHNNARGRLQASPASDGELFRSAPSSFVLLELSMKILLIGGTGLISGACLRLLKKQGHQVSIYHRGSTPLKMKGVQEILGDRKDRKAFESAMKLQRFDAVIDAILFNREDAQSAMRAFSGRVKRYHFISTVCAVGAPLTKIPSDEAEPYQPISDYGRNKAEAERLLLQAYRNDGFPVTIFRPSYTYGPGAGFALGTFLCGEQDCELMNRMLRGEGVIVHGDGETLWQSCLADEVAEGIVGALKRPKTLGQIYNLCGHEILSWNQYYEKMGLALDKKVKLFHLPSDSILSLAPSSATGFLREIGRYHGAYSNAKALREIPEFRPRTPLQEGLRKHYQWLKADGRLRRSARRPFEDQLVKLAKKIMST